LYHDVLYRGLPGLKEWGVSHEDQPRRQ
jgi:hypothetical protein